MWVKIRASEARSAGIGANLNQIARWANTFKANAEAVEIVAHLVAIEWALTARMMALCFLPRTNPGNRLQYKRQNGPFTLYMVGGGGNKLPYGPGSRPKRYGPKAASWF